MTTLAQRIIAARSAAGLTQRQLSELSGVSQQMISKLETGKTTETTFIVPLARALKVSVDWLADEKGSPKIGNVSEGVADYSQSGLTDDQIKALQLVELLTSKQRAEWFRWAEDRERENEEVISEVGERIQKKKSG